MSTIEMLNLIERYLLKQVTGNVLLWHEHFVYNCLSHNEMLYIIFNYLCLVSIFLYSTRNGCIILC